MQLISELVNGFSDAPAGFARIYRRGTSTNATAYSDFKGQNSVSTHTLNDRGRVIRYVNELVDVSVFDVNGTQVVDTFTPSGQATTVEIIHPRWTGTDYDTGASAVSEPLTLYTALDAIYTSSGAIDGKVLQWGSATLLKDAIWSDPILRTSSAATSYAPNAGVYQYHEVVSTGATFEWSTPTNPPTDTSRTRLLFLRYKNTSGGNVTPTLSTGYYGDAAAIANNSAMGWIFHYEHTLARWVQDSRTAAYAS